MQQLVIKGFGSISSLGDRRAGIWSAYENGRTAIRQRTINGKSTVVAHLPLSCETSLSELRASDERYQELDKTVLMAMFSARQAIREAGWRQPADIAVNIGSSRGATSLFERHHRAYLEDPQHRVSPLASPTTTLGNIASWVGQDIGSSGLAVSHSITCSTALHAIINAVVWLRSGIATKVIAGGAEAPLTGFTIAQMKALRIYSKDTNAAFPCKPLAKNARGNSLVLGEAAGVFCLEQTLSAASNQIYVDAIGFATEALTHNVSLSADGACLQRSMSKALGNMATTSPVDAIILHAPGTLKGDEAELAAVREVFGKNMPLVTCNKWKIGHTFGASGAMSLEFAILMLQHQQFIDFPYESIVENAAQPLRKIMVNAVGFGGNAASIIVRRE